MKSQLMLVTFLLAALLAAPWVVQPIAAQETSQDTAGLLQAIVLPTISDILRERGVPIGEVEEAVIGAREKGIPAEETAAILEETAATVEEHGPIENFGAFVQAQLEAGLRGRELAAAIRAEHARRGIGKGNKLAPGSRGRGQGGPPGAGRGQGQRPGEVDPGRVGPDTSDPAARGRGQTAPAADSGRRGPPEGRGQGAKRPDTVPDTTRSRRGGGNGGEA